MNVARCESHVVRGRDLGIELVRLEVRRRDVKVKRFLRKRAHMPNSAAGIEKYIVARHISLRVPQPGSTGAVSPVVS